MKAESQKKIDHDHIKFLKASIRDIKRKKFQEKKIVKELGIKLYEKWLELKQVRKKQDYETSTVELKVKEFELQNRKREYIFYLNNKEPIDKTYSGRPIPSYEISRRKKVRSINAYVDMFVNGHKVERSRTANVSWPSFEAEFGDMFTLFLYTMPKSIELRLYIDGSEI